LLFYYPKLFLILCFKQTNTNKQTNKQTKKIFNEQQNHRKKENLILFLAVLN